MRSPQAINAGTTYGVDSSPGNNYGLGTGYRSIHTNTGREAAKNAKPSWMWLALVLVVALAVL